MRHPADRSTKFAHAPAFVAALTGALLSALTPSPAFAAAAGAPPMPVATLEVAEQAIPRTYSLPGRIAAFRQSDVRPQVNGILTERLFEEGQAVQKGQQLYQIDDTRYRAVLNRAVADLHRAEANLASVKARARRYETLRKSNTVSQQDYDDAVAALDLAEAEIGVARAQVALSRVDVDFSRITAPISGRIGRSLVTVGALVTANQPAALATITALDPVYVDMQESAGQSEVRALLADRGAKNAVPVQLMLDAGDGQRAYPQPGVLKFSEVTMDASTGATTLRAEVPNPDAALLPGMFVHAVLDLGEMEAVLVPQRATTRTPEGELIVWVVDADSIVHRRSIDVRSAFEDNWVVQTGLVAGEIIIMEGYQKVRDGQPVAPEAWIPPGEAVAEGTGAPAGTH